MVDNLSSPPRTGPGGRSDYSASCSPEDQPKYNYSSSSQYMISTPLAIRGAPMDLAPPPLPPPRHPPIGHPTKQIWHHHGHSPPASVSLPPGSSLAGGWNRPDERLSVPRRTNIQMPSSPLRNSERAIKREEDVEPFPSLTAKFQEPRPFDHQTHRNTADAYDKHQLSKLGRPKTPTRSSTLGSVESSPIAGHRLRVDTQASFHKLTLADRSIGAQSLDSPFKTSSPLGRWPSQTHSGAFSPSMMSTATSTNSLAELRSPTYEPSTAPSSLATENNEFSRVKSSEQGMNASLSLLSSAFEENERDPKRIGHVTRDRGSDLGAGRFGGYDPDPPDFMVQHGSARSNYGETREHDQHRQFSLGSLMADVSTTAQKGLKRKASPNDTSVYEPVAQAVRSHTPGRSTKRTSPAHQPNPLQTSFSSFSSASPRNASYASTNLSLAPSSVTSIGSQEYSSPSGLPSGNAGSTEIHQSQSPYRRPMSLEPNTRASPGHVALPSLSVQAQANAALQQERAVSGARSEASTAGTVKPPLANIHMCDCCPKKPKKFATLEALQAHKNEKQYQCNYCLNRFKNKNEAERHQNSLHLRRQSWSCAALENHYEKAFHACTAASSGPSAQIGAPAGHGSDAEYDACGYCGKQFKNYPNPDWIERGKHLTEVHKFGECNQSKKFFRADHFRQHLKHSHEGVPGRWTNMLESACLRDEPPPPPIDHEAQEKLHQQQHSHQVQASQALQAAQQQQ